VHYTNAKTKPELQRRVFVTKISLSRRIGLHARCRLLVLITSHAAPSQSPMLSVQCVVVSTARVDAGLGVPVPEYPALVSPVIAGLYILIVCGRRRYSFRRRPAFKTVRSAANSSEAWRNTCSLHESWSDPLGPIRSSEKASRCNVLIACVMFLINLFIDWAVANDAPRHQIAVEPCFFKDVSACSQRSSDHDDRPVPQSVWTLLVGVRVDTAYHCRRITLSVAVQHWRHPNPLQRSR